MDSRNIIFIMLDTVRADILKPYGGDADVPTITGLSRNGIKYNMAIAPGTYTLPSHLSLFLGKRAGRIPWLQSMGMRFSEMMTDPLLRNSRYVAGSRELTTAQVMEYFGYRSALFSNNPFVSEATGLAAGFSHVSNLFIDKKLRSGSPFVRSVLGLIQNGYTRRGLVDLAYRLSSVIPSRRVDGMYLSLRKRVNRYFSNEYGYYDLDKGARETNRQLDHYLKANRSGRNFIFINYMEGHEGYPTNLVTKGYVEQDKWLHMTGKASKEDLEFTKRAYIKRIEYLDRMVGRAIRIMKKNGILDNATLIVSSDHGQAFMEHGAMFHNIYPYNEVARVPLVIVSFRSGRQVRDSMEIDAPFSLTELNRIITGRKMDGVGDPVFTDHTGITEVWDTHLLRLFRSRSRNADMIYRKKIEQDVHASAVFYKDRKLIHFYGRRKDEMYNLAADPDESDNIIDRERGIAHKLLACNSAC